MAAQSTSSAVARRERNDPWAFQRHIAALIREHARELTLDDFHLGYLQQKRVHLASANKYGSTALTYLLHRQHLDRSVVLQLKTKTGNQEIKNNFNHTMCGKSLLLLLLLLLLLFVRFEKQSLPNYSP